VSNEAAADGLTGLRGAPAAQRQRAAELVAEAHRGDDVVTIAGHDHAERFDLIDAGVGGIKRASDAIEADFAGNRSAKRTLEAGGIDP